MKKRGMTAGGRIAAEIVFAVMVVLTALQSIGVLLIWDNGAYHYTQGEYEYHALESYFRSYANSLLEAYAYYGEESAAELGVIYINENMGVDWVISYEGKKELLIPATQTEKKYSYKFQYEQEYYEHDHDDETGYTTTYVVECNVKSSSDYYGIDNVRRDTENIYLIRYVILFTTPITALIALILLAILVKRAGEVKGKEELQLRWVDRIPFDLHFLVNGILLCLGFGIFDDVGGNDWSMVVVVTVAVLAISLVLMWLLMTWSVRLKQGEIWKNTIINMVCRRLKRNGKKGFVYLQEKIPLIWKGLAVLLGISVLEGFILYICYDTYVFDGPIIIFWFIEKIVIFGIAFIVLMNLKQLQKGGEVLASGDLTHQIDTKNMFWEFKRHGENLNRISDGMQHAVEERMKSEYFKTELITNVSHDIKTPLTSIINYVDLLEKEDFDIPAAREYLVILDKHSHRLKRLIEDLIEASKASTGALSVNLENCEVGVLLTQAAGEFEEKLNSNELDLIIRKPEDELVISADRKHLWRVFDNLLNNIYKYAQPGTRVYLDMQKTDNEVTIIFRNTSRYALNITSDELQERFVRGDSSRTTEGSGLGISIAKNLMELMHGDFELIIDGDLFKVILTFPFKSE